MRNTFMLAVGIAAGMGAMMGIQKISENKQCVKKTLNDLVDDTADMFN